MALHLVSEAEAVILREMVKEYKNRKHSNPVTNTPNQTYYAPEVYIAYPPSGGIPALERAADTGTLVPGTASGDFDRPGSAECSIYRIVASVDGIEELIPVDGITRIVYNITTSTIPQDWISVKRDKWGSWLADTGGTGSAACTPQNAIMKITIIGVPDAGFLTLSQTINAVQEDIDIWFDATAAEVETAFEGHSEIGIGDVLASGGPLQTTAVLIEFIGNLADTNIALPIESITNLGTSSGTGTGSPDITDQIGIGAITSLTQLGISE